MFVSTFFIAAAGTWVTEKIVIPRFGTYKGDVKAEEIKPLSQDEKRGLWYTLQLFQFLALIIISRYIT